MSFRATLTQLAKAIVKEHGKPMSEALRASMGSLEAEPAHVFDLIELLNVEGTKKRSDDRMTGAYSFLLAQALEFLRYGVERNDRFVIALIEQLRARLLKRGRSKQIRPETLQIVLQSFAVAKLEMGNDLRDLLHELALSDSGEDDTGDGLDPAEIGRGLADIAKGLGNDPFVIHERLSEIGQTLPDDVRPGMVMALMGQKEAVMREAAIGFLLDSARPARETVVKIAGLAAPERLGNTNVVSPLMLRRLMTMRDWIPAAERPALDVAITTCHDSGITAAPLKQPANIQVLASGIDGAGTHTILVVVGKAGKFDIAGILLKHGVGISDVWVMHKVPKSRVREIVASLRDQIDMGNATLELASMAMRHYLAVNLQSGVLPPFALVDFVETVGLIATIPQELPVDSLVQSLLATVDPARLTPAAVAKTLHDSGRWPEDYPTLEAWFEPDLETSLGRKPDPARQLAVLLSGPLQSKRRRWAELAAWTAATLKHEPENDGWQDFAILARELLGSRPLDEIGLMRVIAKTSLEVLAMERLYGSRRAA